MRYRFLIDVELTEREIASLQKVVAKLPACTITFTREEYGSYTLTVPYLPGRLIGADRMQES